ncbi:outer membrane protein [Desulfurivibrio sp. C05AmB]|uniref:outer membrane protein n=1 Tax=Desulfurivibrio sp. C05AmB TaxID=3374371 RepID=UPI00376F309E
MKKYLSIAFVFALSLGFIATTAQAQTYAFGNLAAVWVSDADAGFDIPGFGTGITLAEISFDSGIGITGGFGHAYGNGLRTEVELAYRKNDLDQLAGRGPFVGAPRMPLNGDISSLALMINGFYDFNLGLPVTPFAGGGLGIARVRIDSDWLGVDSSDTVFAYQLGAGLAFALNPQVNIDLQYRFFATLDPELKFQSGERFDTEYMTHNVMLGLRYSF